MTLRYRSVVDGRDLISYATWVRELRFRNGVYVVRDRTGRDVLYVGESHSGRLYSTLTRHFQYWKGYTAGTTYDRDHVEVAVSHLDAPSKDVVHAQVSLIEELRPRDNKHHQLELDDVDDEDWSDDWT